MYIHECTGVAVSQYKVWHNKKACTITTAASKCRCRSVNDCVLHIYCALLRIFVFVLIFLIGFRLMNDIGGFFLRKLNARSNIKPAHFHSCTISYAYGKKTINVLYKVK